MARGILLTFRNLLMELFLSLMLLIGGAIPVAGLLAPLALLLTSAYYYGFSLIDYSLEQRGYSIRRSVWYVKNHRGLAMGSGLMLTLTMMIPFVGIFLAGFVGIVSVVGATLAVNQVADLD
jgi:CysZ protein